MASQVCSVIWWHLYSFKDKSSTSPLQHFNFIDVLCGVRSPCIRGIFSHWQHECFKTVFLNTTWTGPQISTQERKGCVSIWQYLLIQVSLESIITPKYLTEFSFLNGTSLMWYVNLGGDILFVAIRNSHFDVLNSIWCILDWL